MWTYMYVYVGDFCRTCLMHCVLGASFLLRHVLRHVLRSMLGQHCTRCLSEPINRQFSRSWRWHSSVDADVKILTLTSNLDMGPNDGIPPCLPLYPPRHLRSTAIHAHGHSFQTLSTFITLTPAPMDTSLHCSGIFLALHTASTSGV